MSDVPSRRTRRETARASRRRYRRRTSPWVVVGALLGTSALGAHGATAAANRSATTLDRRAAIVVERIAADLTRVAVWTPGETLAALHWTDDGAAQQPREMKFDIPPGNLGTAIAQFEKLTGLQVAVADEGIRTLPSPGVVGLYTPQRALDALLAGTAVAYRFTAPAAITLELRVQSEAVEVTGTARVPSPKFTEPIRDTPQTITVVPQEVIQAQGATTLRDVLRNVPGITYQAGEGGGGLPGDTLSIRGFSATGDIFVDGIRDVGAYTRDSFNLEQVEVVKGPASTYAGRGATGGSINLTTKMPHTAPAYAGSASGGNAGFRRGTIDVNQPLGDAAGGSSLRLNAMWAEAGVPGRNVVENGSWAIAPSVAAGLSSRTRLVASYVHFRQDNVPDYGLPWAAFGATPEVDQSNFYGLRNYDYEDIDNDVATVQVSHQVGAATSLRNVSRYGRTERDSAITAPRPPNRQLQQRTMTNSILANQTALTSDVRVGRTRHSVVAGIELSREEVDNFNRAQTTNQPQTELYHPNPDELPFGPMPPNTGNPSNAVTATVGGYLFDTAHLTEKIQATGGLRWDRSDVDYSLDNLVTGERTVLGRTDRMVSWRAGVVYKPRPEASLYAGMGTSFNPAADAAATGTALSDNPTAANNVNLEPEKSRNAEVGVKWDLLGARLAVAAAVFRTEKTNARTRNLANEPFVLDGRHRVDGVELSVSGRVTPRWSAFGGFVLMDSTIVASANPDERSNDLALVPERSFSLWTTYDFPWRLTVGGGAQFADNVFRNASNTLSVPSYWIVNGLASYAVNEHLTLRLNANNLGDKEYVDRVGGGHYIPGPRRSIALSTDVRF